MVFLCFVFKVSRLCRRECEIFLVFLKNCYKFFTFFMRNFLLLFWCFKKYSPKRYGLKKWKKKSLPKFSRLIFTHTKTKKKDEELLLMLLLFLSHYYSIWPLLTFIYREQPFISMMVISMLPAWLATNHCIHSFNLLRTINSVQRRRSSRSSSEKAWLIKNFLLANFGHFNPI